MSHSLDTRDPTFVEDLLKSDKAVWSVARHLRLRGATITLPPITIRGDDEDISDCSDHGDMTVTWRGRDYLVEVKHRPDLTFRRLSDFPYPTIIVDTQHHWEALEVKPHSYYVCNADLTGAVVVTSATADRWVPVEKWDTKRNRARKFLECPLILCQYREF